MELRSWKKKNATVRRLEWRKKKILVDKERSCKRVRWRGKLVNQVQGPVGI